MLTPEELKDSFFTDILIKLDDYLLEMCHDAESKWLEEHEEELRKPHGNIIFEYIVRAFRHAGVPHNKWRAAIKEAHDSMAEEGWNIDIDTLK